MYIIIIVSINFLDILHDDPILYKCISVQSLPAMFIQGTNQYIQAHFMIPEIDHPSQTP